MSVDSNFASMFNNLKLEDPWLPPRPWESIPSQSGPTPSPPPPPQPLFDTSSVSEASLVRLALNALQGVQSAIISIEKLSDAFCTDPADRSFHHIPNLWSRVSSTHALGNILKSIGCSGSLVFLLHKFVDYFTNFNFDDNSAGNKPINSEPAENQNDCVNNMDEEDRHPPYTLVNQAFAVAVRKVLEGYICALDTLYSSASLRRSSKDVEMPLHSSFGVGCVTGVLHSDITLLEVYLHTRELSSQIEALGNICNLHDVALCFSISSFEDLIVKALLEFSKLPRGGDMLSYLYTQLQVADPAHRALLKFLFLQSCEPYFGFIRAWIYKAEINDPYKEFIVEHLENLPSHSLGKAGFSTDFPSVTVKERDGIAIPCFLKDFTILLVRAGQQLQVVMKLLELCNYISNRDHSIESFLPCWTGFSSEHPSYTSPLIFNKVKIEAMTLERNNYYKRMQEKVESFLTKLELNYQQGSLQIFFANDGGTSAIPESFTSNDVLSAPPGSYMVAADVDFEASSVEDDYSYSPDPLESSECSSLSSSEDHIESEKHIQFPTSLPGLEQKYFSALNFSVTASMKKSLQDPLENENSFHIGGGSSVIWGKSNGVPQFVCSHHKQKELNHTSVPLESGELDKAILSDMQSADGLASFSLPINSVSVSSFCVGGGCSEDKKLHSSVSDHRFRTGYMGVTKEDISHLGNKLTGSSGSIEKASDDDHNEEGILASSNLFTLPPLALKSNCSFLSKNPLLTKNIFSRVMSQPRDSCSPDHGESFPCFDFSSVEDPCKVYGDKLSANSRHRFGSGSPSVTASSTSATSGKTANQDQEGYDKHGVSINNFKMSDAESPLSLKTHSRDDVTLTNASGGGGWQSLLGLRGNSVNENVRDHRQSLSAMFEIPLDFIIDKCLLQEILLQYKYISKLTIKLLEEGFDLHEHLLALRRYHFMELADWADLFIMSLWHHKWCGTEVDHRVSGMQGILELSLQRSSCEQDHNKNRLFVYMKKHGTVPLSTSTIGVRSFDFLGLGYRVDWPVSIVLTPDAMKIYGDIFSFLIQVKVAVFSLTDVWRSLKELKHFINKSCHSNLHEREVHHFNLLIKIRYQVSHFVSTLQQYVQSQLSHVSWCRFLHSLQHKVKDMMDLETVHMEYLTDSLHICFLSDETKSVAIIIESILQCALDFRSCLTGNMWDVGVDQEDPLSKLSRINISQVLAMKQSFEKNLKELHLCYLSSPKHGESGLSRFWGYLNFNEYYGDNEMGSYSFSV